MVASLSRVRERTDRRGGNGRTSRPTGAGVARAASAASGGRHFLGAATPHVLQECEGHHHEHDVVVPAPPRTPLDVVEAEYVLQLAVAVFHQPVALGNGDQPLQTRFRRQVAEEVTRRRFGALGPLGEQPACGEQFLARREPVRRPHPQGGESARRPPLRPFPLRSCQEITFTSSSDGCRYSRRA